MSSNYSSIKIYDNGQIFRKIIIIEEFLFKQIRF